MRFCSSEALQRWLVGLGDPGLTPWVVVLFYLCIAAFSWRAARRQSGTRAAIFWRSISAIALFLALNKQLDLQTLILRCGRVAVTSVGWSVYRRSIEAIVAIVIGVTVAAIFVRAAMIYRRMHFAERIAILGMALVTLSIVSRSTVILHLGSGLPLATAFRDWPEVLGSMLMMLGAGLAAPTESRDLADKI